MLAVSSASKHIFKGLASGGLGVFVALLVQVMTVPLFIQSWGVDYYADWILLSALPLVLSVSDIGIINVQTNRAAILFSRGSNTIACKYLATAIGLTVPIAIVILILIFLIVQFAVTESLIEDRFFVLIFLLMHSFCSLIGNFYTSAFRSVRAFHLGSYGVNCARLLEFFVICIVLFCDYKALALSIGLFLARSISVFVIARIFSRYAKFSIFDISFNLFRVTIHSSLSYFLIPLVQLGYPQVVVFLAASKFDAKFVIFFNSARVLARLVLLVSGVLVGAWRQELTRSFGRAEFDLFSALFFRLIALNFLVAFLYVIAAYLLGGFIFDMWLGNNVIYLEKEFSLILLSVSITAICSPFQGVLIALNKHGSYSMCMFFVSVVGSLLLFVSINAMAFLWGVLFVEGLIFICAVFLVTKLFFTRFWKGYNLSL